MDDLLPDVERLTDGVEIVENVYDQPGVETPEGRIGMVLQGESVQAHFIDMPPGLYLDEHAHDTESIIVTLSGEWVLCARGERHHMQSGDVFRFGPGVPTGYEVPFDEPAFVLVFKGERTDDSPEAFVEYLQEDVPELMAAEREDGAVFTFEELPNGHPAKEFARSLGREYE